MFGLNKYLVIGIIVAIVIGLGSVAIYQWRADIKQVAYDHIFRQMAENELNVKQNEINRLTSLAASREKAVETANREKEQAQKAVVNLGVILRNQTYNKEPVSPGLSKALDAIQDYGRVPPPTNSGAPK